MPASAPAPPTHIPDLRHLPLKQQAEQRTNTAAAILKRILRGRDVEVPAAAFQSSI